MYFTFGKSILRTSGKVVMYKNIDQDLFYISYKLLKFDEGRRR